MSLRFLFQDAIHNVGNKIGEIIFLQRSDLISAQPDKQSAVSYQLRDGGLVTSAANRLIGEVVQSRRRALLGPSPG